MANPLFCLPRALLTAMEICTLWGVAATIGRQHLVIQREHGISTSLRAKYQYTAAFAVPSVPFVSSIIHRPTFINIDNKTLDYGNYCVCLFES